MLVKVSNYLFQIYWSFFRRVIFLERGGPSEEEGWFFDDDGRCGWSSSSVTPLSWADVPYMLLEGKTTISDAVSASLVESSGDVSLVEDCTDVPPAEVVSTTWVQ